jgi:hypothetical protein
VVTAIDDKSCISICSLVNYELTVHSRSCVTWNEA